VAIVTGGGSRGDDIGNGRAAAILLARVGAKVALIDIEPSSVERTRQMIADEGGEAAVFPADVSDAESVQSAVADIFADLGTPAVLFNNVGLAGPPGTAVDVDLEAWEATWRVNVNSMLLTCRFVIPLMEAAGGGSIVNMSSAAGIRAGHPAITYAATKGAIPQMTRTMAGHHGLAGVRVNCVAPGMVYTPMVTSRGMTDEMREARRRRSLLQIEGTGWDVGNAVLFLASDLARWVTGVTLPVDAGYTAGMPLPTPPRS
jgi:NAD(P)-dependent dehydrogenase (short-subunit alcohol dehydrogenase family)